MTCDNRVALEKRQNEVRGTGGAEGGMIRAEHQIKKQNRGRDVAPW